MDKGNNEIVYNDFGEKIKAIRKEFDYFQEDLAEKVTKHFIDKKIILSQADISSIESGKSIVSKKILLIISYFYEVHNVLPAYFFQKEIESKNMNKNKMIDKIFEKYDTKYDKLKNNLVKDLKKINLI
jgi:transcriptional regulator with XRE-family HTH domain